MALLKIIMSLVWMTALAVGIVLFIQGVWDGNINMIRISVFMVIISVPTLIAIIRDVK